MNPRVLVFVLDLVAAIGDGGVDAAGEEPAFVLDEGVAHAAQGHRQVTRWGGGGVVVLVEHLIGRREDDAMGPVDALEVLVPVVPQQRIAMAADGEDVEVGAVAVALLIRPDRHLGGVRVHGAVGEDELHVRRSGAARLPGLEAEIGEIGHEVCLPHIAPRADGDELALAAEVTGGAFALGEAQRVFEDETLVVEQVQHDAEVVDRGEARGLGARAVEVLVMGVERQGEEALGAPLEAVLLAVMGLDRGAAMAREDVDHLFEEMALRRGLAAGCDIDDEYGDEIAPPLEVHQRAIGIEPGPGLGLDLQKIDAQLLDDGNAFPLGPFDIGVEQEFQVFGIRRVCHGFGSPYIRFASGPIVAQGPHHSGARMRPKPTLSPALSPEGATTRRRASPLP